MNIRTIVYEITSIGDTLKLSYNTTQTPHMAYISFNSISFIIRDDYTEISGTDCKFDNSRLIIERNNDVITFRDDNDMFTWTPKRFNEPETNNEIEDRQPES